MSESDAVNRAAALRIVVGRTLTMFESEHHETVHLASPVGKMGGGGAADRGHTSTRRVACARNA
jgi:hypothetical protein